LVVPGAVGEYLAQRFSRALEVSGREVGLEQPLAQVRLLRVLARPDLAVEAQRAHDGAADVPVLEALRTGRQQRAVHRRTKQADEDEVVEVTGLKRRIL